MYHVFLFAKLAAPTESLLHSPTLQLMGCFCLVLAQRFVCLGFKVRSLHVPFSLLLIMLKENR